jgi:thiol-disulfide isomerase/thioredoxin
MMRAAMKRISLWIVLVLACTVVANAEDFSVRVFKPSAPELAFKVALDTTQGFTQQKALAKDYQSKYPNDMGVQLRVAGFLAVENLDSTRDYYSSLAERDPANAAAVYIAGKLAQSPSEQRKYADQLLQKDPDSYWGNLLLAGSYTAESDPGFQKAEAALRKAIAKDNSLPYAVERLGHLLEVRGETQAADDVYVKLGEIEPAEFSPVYYRIKLAAGDQAKAVKLLDEFLSRNPDNVDALYTKAHAQREQADWKGHLETMRKLLSVSRTGDHAYDLGCGYSLAGQRDSAFTWLFTAADLGFTDIEQYKSDEDLFPLRDDPRWSDLLAKVDSAQRAKLNEFMKQAAATAPQRKEEALAERMNVPAPDFSLKDLDDKQVSLTSLRGKVVILDFWATWCGPCKMSMPLLDKFYTDSKPKDVVVYGVNVWERGGTDKVKPFLTERGVHFPVLYGTNDIASAYGVRGIPTLVVIDKEGKIAYRHIGYDPTLVDILTWQTKSLLK